jgi:RHS repeat-associated protein
MRTNFLLFIAFLVAGPLLAQKSPKENAQVWLGINCKIYAGANYDLTLTPAQPGEALPLDATYTNWVNTSTLVTPGDLRVQVYPGRLYTFDVYSSSWTSADLHFDVPAGYSLYMGYNGSGRTPVTSYLANSTASSTYSVTLELRPNDRAAQLPIGQSLPPQVNDVNWAVSLGFTARGESAGTIRWRRPSVTTDLLDAVNLDYVDPESDEVLAERFSDGALKYVSTYQGQVRVFRNTDPTTGYTINFYQPDADPGSDRNFTGVSPFASYAIESPAANQVRIIHTQDGPTEYWLLSVSGSTTTIKQLSDATTPVREFEYASTLNSPSSGQRTEVVTTKYTGGSADRVIRRIYQTFTWGEELISETADPSGANLTTTYTYYTSGWPTSGNAGKLATIERPDGSWVKYDYSDAFASWGHLLHIYRPWQDSPTAASSATTSNCHVTTLLYDGQRSIYDDIPAGTQTHINNTQTAGSSASFSFGTQTDYDDSGYGAPIRTDTIVNQTLSGTSLTTTRKVFNTGVIPSSGSGATIANPRLAGQLYSQTNPDGTRVSAAYSVGNWTSYLGGTSSLWDSYTFTANHSTGIWRIATYFNGNSTAVSGADSTPVTSWHGHTIESVYLTPNRSTRRDVITKEDGGLVQEITSVYTGSGNYKVISWTHTDYAKGLPIVERNSTAAYTSRTYVGGRISSETQADGTVIDYTRDSLYRLTRVQKSGVSSTGGFPAQGAINTDYTYNAADQVLTTTVAPAAGGLSLVSSSTYNLAGQLTGSTDERGLSATVAYTNGGRTTTVTMPGGATKITDLWRDGSLKSITGTAVVAAYSQTDVNTSDGTLTFASYVLRSSDLSSPTSAPRWTKVTKDWAGRTIKQEQPAPPSASPSTFTKQYYYNSSTQLTKTTETGLADFLYQYDAQGELQYSGLDINADGDLDLAGPDRVTEVRSSVYYDSGTTAWYARNLTYVYNQESSSTALLQSDVRTRLAPYPGTSTNFDDRQVMTETRSYDVFGNLTVQTGVLARATRLGTVTTNVPDSSVDAVETVLNGLKVRSQTPQNLTSDYLYDGLGRLVKTTDPRTDTSSTARIGYYTSGTGQIGQVQWRDDPAGNRTSFTYESTTGRLATETDPLSKVARYSYTTRGESYRTWGDTGYPVEYAYDDYGQRVTMKTYRAGTGWTGSTWPGSPGTADTTTWAYDNATGTLTSKTDVSSEVVAYTRTYTYTTRGQLKTRTWARGVTTTYNYSTTTAEQTGIDYSDSTPDLTYTYNRLGQTKQVIDATSANSTDYRTFNYSTTSTQLTSEDLPSGFFGTRRLTYPYATSGVIGRSTGLQLGTSGSPAAEQNVTYGYDAYGRFNSLGGGGLTLTYSYTANSNLLSSIADSVYGWTQTRAYLSNRDLLDLIETKWAANSKAKFDYAHDNLGRRTSVAKTGEMYSRYSSAGLDTHWGYNDRSEVTSEVSKLGGTSTVLTGRDDTFAFDNIGNRSSATHNGTSSSYTANALNQYTQRAVDGSVDVTGLAPAAATVTINSSTSGITRHNDWYFKSLGVTNTSTAAWQSVTASSSLGGSSTRNTFVALTPEPFTYDDDGNLTSDGRWDYTYDAENRVVAMQTKSTVIGSAPLMPNADARRLEFKNDYLGRRAQKTVRAGWNGSSFTTVVSDERFVYNGWNAIAKLNALSSNALVASYYWGLDWSGTLQGAGGVGGLALSVEGGNSYLPMLDGNGNVMGLIKASSGSIDAAYEYDAFGQTLRESGSYAASNPFRFSTKYTDAETSLVYYGLRYYSPALGRFINKDPIEEQGGLNLYGFCANNGVNRWDYLGMDPDDALAYKYQQAWEYALNNGGPVNSEAFTRALQQWYADDLDPNGGGGATSGAAMDFANDSKIYLGMGESPGADMMMWAHGFVNPVYGLQIGVLQLQDPTTGQPISHNEIIASGQTIAVGYNGGTIIIGANAAIAQSEINKTLDDFKKDADGELDAGFPHKGPAPGGCMIGCVQNAFHIQGEIALTENEVASAFAKASGRTIEQVIKDGTSFAIAVKAINSGELAKYGYSAHLRDFGADGFKEFRDFVGASKAAIVNYSRGGEPHAVTYSVLDRTVHDGYTSTSAYAYSYTREMPDLFKLMTPPRSTVILRKN